MRVLVVEDEARMARNVAQLLQERLSCAVDVSTDGEDGWHMAKSNPYDLVVLDLMLPKIGGLEIVKRLRAAQNRTPVLVLTARDSTEDIVQGLDMGCDDYLTKPFDIAELVARCRALIRRSYDQPSPTVVIGDLRINTASRVVTYRKQAGVLPAMEYRLLEYLAMRAGQVVSKEDILEHLYDFDTERFSNVVEVYISSLRKRFSPDLIRTVRGQGYVLGEAGQ
jgi:two-component system response regulator PhoP